MAKTKMKASPNCIKVIKEFEGFRARPYLCTAGVPTIGYGSTRYADGKYVTLQDAPISTTDAEALLYATLATEYESAVNRYVQVPLNQNQYDALVSFVYNVGAKNFLNSTMLRRINVGDFVGAANQFSEWIYAGKKKVNGLMIRRKQERVLFELKP